MIISESHLRHVIQEVMLAEYVYMGKPTAAAKRASKKFGDAYGKAYQDSEKKRKKTGHMSAYAAAEAARSKNPKGKKQAASTITDLSIKVMWGENRKELAKVIKRFEPFVRKEKTKELKKIKEGVSSGKNVGPDQWIALAKLTDKKRAGEILGARLAWRQEIVDITLEIVQNQIKSAITYVVKRIKESDDPVEEVKNIWSAIPEDDKQVSSLATMAGVAVTPQMMMITREGIRNGATVAVLKWFGKLILRIGTVAAALSAITAIFQYGKYKSKLSDTADKLIGADSVTLKNKFIPSNLKKGTAKKGYAGLAQGILGDQKSTAAGYAAIKKAMGRN